MSAAPCPCGSEQCYADCCGRWHAGVPAPTAEALMRSRYSAFVLMIEPYLLATWHPSTRPESVGFEPGTKWLGLSVKAVRDTASERSEAGAGADRPGASRTRLPTQDTVSAPARETGPDAAEVEFVARYRVGGGSAVRLVERSRFVHEAGRWYYMDAAD